MRRIEAIEALGEIVTAEDLFTSSVGILWDDWWNNRPDRADNTFSPAAIGSISPIALGLALSLPHRRVIALDTDGSMLMNTGIMCTLGGERPPNLTVIVFDNEIYESIGGSPTLTGVNTDLAKMAEGAGCINCIMVDNLEDLTLEAKRLLTDDEFGFLVAKIEPGIKVWAQEERKPTDGVEDKYRFLRHVEKTEGRRLNRGADQSHVGEVEL
jgi:thiamine pyrophosphate-dependent acetolactate synthase large subunit-like protein